jgi:hypothetical protein
MPDKKKPIATDTPVSIKYNKAVELANKVRPTMLQKQSRSRINRPDTPLAATPTPAAIDNTYVKKPIVKNN